MPCVDIATSLPPRCYRLEGYIVFIAVEAPPIGEAGRFRCATDDLWLGKHVLFHYAIQILGP
jgi:hypothetical protein